MISPDDLMRLAIETCRHGLARGQSPFGCAIAIGDRVVSREHNTVVLTTDITAHAEINAIRAANRAIGSIFLEGAIVATTCEPCPMCMAALHWARVESVYYGATIADASAAEFNELQFPAASLLRAGGSRVRLTAGTLAEECRQLFAEWASDPQHRAY
jgi:tRNA(Arg) A34 adenosine deaminase TadA